MNSPIGRGVLARPGEFIIGIEGLPARANGAQGASWHTKWAKNHPIRDQATMLARDIHNRFGTKFEFAEVEITLLRSHRSNRPFDYENMTIMAKGVIDGLRFGGLITDDDDKHLKRLYSQRRAEEGEKPGFILRIREWVPDAG